MTRPVNERLASLETKFENFEERYERDRDEAKADRVEMNDKLDRLIAREHQFAGMVKLAGIARWIIAGLVTLAGAVGAQKIAAWLSQLAK